jgi:hypothetical protein
MREFRDGLSLESDIPSSHPQKAAIELAIRDFFRHALGSWRVGILLVQGAPWWVVYVLDTRSGLRRSALLDSPKKQTPESVIGIVRELMQERRKAPRPPLRSV